MVRRKVQRRLAPRWLIKKMDRGDVVSQPLPHAEGGERDPATSSRSAAEAAVRRDEEMDDAERSKREAFS